MQNVFELFVNINVGARGIVPKIPKGENNKMVITSKDNELIKHIRKLKEKKYRDEFGEFVVEGAKMIEEAIHENAKIKHIIVCDDCKTENSMTQEQLYDIAKFDCIYVSEKIFSLVTDVVAPQGILAVIEKPMKSENKIDYKANHFLLLDNICPLVMYLLHKNGHLSLFYKSSY